MHYHDGDLIGVSSNGIVPGIINLGTFALPAPLPGAGISHVGMVCHYHGTPLVYETTTFDRPPCVLQGVKVRGCQAHRLDDYLKFVPGRIFHYPLRRALYDHEADRLQRSLDADLGTPYDFIGAVRSGGLLYRLLQILLRPEDTSSLFCSEWCVNKWREIGLIRTYHDGSWNPNKLARRAIWSGIVGEPRRLK